MVRDSRDAPQAPSEAHPNPNSPAPAQRKWVARGFTWLEDIVYLGLGILLGVSALVLLITSALSLGSSMLNGDLADNIIILLDQILLILLIVELLYTVQVSFREHLLTPEPFLIIVLIASTRRVLVLTAEFPKLIEQGDAALRNAMIELGLLTVMIVAFVTSLHLLRKQGTPPIKEQTTPTQPVSE